MTCAWEKEKKSCTYCHGKVVKDQAEMVKNLKPVGTCCGTSQPVLISVIVGPAIFD
jgi:hypothetical protein